MNNNNDPRRYLTQDAGVFMYAYLRSTIEYIKKIMEGRDTETQGKYRINRHTPKLVVNSVPLNAGKATFQISISIHKDMQYVQVQLINLSEKRLETQDAYGQLNSDLSTQFIEFDFGAVSEIERETGMLYAGMRSSSIDDGFVVTDINNGYKSVTDVVTTIIKASLDYSLYNAFQNKAQGYRMLDNGIGVEIIQNDRGANVKLHFGEILTRAVKLDSLFI